MASANRNGMLFRTTRNSTSAASWKSLGARSARADNIRPTETLLSCSEHRAAVMSAASSRKTIIEKTETRTVNDTSPDGLRMKKTISSSDKTAFPDKAIASVESYGINVNSLLLNCGLEYNNGINTVSYVGIVMKK